MWLPTCLIIHLDAACELNSVLSSVSTIELGGGPPWYSNDRAPNQAIIKWDNEENVRNQVETVTQK